MLPPADASFATGNMGRKTGLFWYTHMVRQSTVRLTLPYPLAFLSGAAFSHSPTRRNPAAWRTDPGGFGLSDCRPPVEADSSRSKDLAVWQRLAEFGHPIVRDLGIA